MILQVHSQKTRLWESQDGETRVRETSPCWEKHPIPYSGHKRRDWPVGFNNISNY